MSGRDSRRIFTYRQVRQLLIASDSKCERCGTSVTDKPFEVHHRKRFADGGRTELYNGEILCLNCHKEVTKQCQ